jgi:diguanylate cyclase (GGDEF)-like protein
MIDWPETTNVVLASEAVSAPFTVALLEDDAALTRLLRAAFANAGYRVLSFASLTEARERLALEEWDLLLCDRRLPDGDGIDLCHELKSDASAFQRYIIMLTAESGESAVIEGFDRGADDYMTKPVSIPELLARVRAGLRIVDLQKELIRSNRRLETISNTDSLTGLCNRRSFQNELQKAFEQAQRYERPLGLIMVDVDHFKSVNDVHGHVVGDDVLEELGTRIKGSLRKTDLACRFGGEEFAVILPEAHLMQAVQVAEKIRRAVLAKPFTDLQLALAVSLGVASLPHSQFDHVRDFVTAADRALYRAKRAGRNKVELERRSDPKRHTAPAQFARPHAVSM